MGPLSPSKAGPGGLPLSRILFHPENYSRDTHSPLIAGYSQSPLAKKPGIKPGFRIRLVNVPTHYFSLFSDFPDEVQQLKDKKSRKDLIHYFSTKSEQLENDMPALRKEIEENGMIWISWPKKSSKVETDLDENVVRNIALYNGLVDVKICAVDETWSALKLVIRLKDRKII